MAGTSGSIPQPQIPIFNGKNYDYWRIKMKTLFCSQGIWNLVENGFTETEEDKKEEEKKNDAKALFFIQQGVEESIFPKVAAATGSKQAWDSLQTTYQGTDKREHQNSLEMTPVFFVLLILLILLILVGLQFQHSVLSFILGVLYGLALYAYFHSSIKW